MGRIIPVAVFLTSIIIFGAYWSRTRLKADHQINSFTDCMDQGFPVMESYPRRCSAYGKTYTEIVPEETPITENTPNITVTSPNPSEVLTLPFRVEGEARVFENRLSYRIIDSKGEIIRNGFLDANSPDVGQFGQYFVDISWVKNTSSEEGRVEVYSNSPKDGSEINLISVPVSFDFGKGVKTSSFFNKKGSDDCNKVYPLTRIMAKTQTPIRDSLLILLSGPTSGEIEDGYLTSINTGTTFEGIILNDGEVKVNFHKNIEENLGGSCRVAAIRAQITETLKQFSTVKTVRILVEGREEDALQP